MILKGINLRNERDKIKLRQYVRLLKSPNFDAENTKCLQFSDHACMDTPMTTG